MWFRRWRGLGVWGGTQSSSILIIGAYGLFWKVLTNDMSCLYERGLVPTVHWIFNKVVIWSISMFGTREKYQFPQNSDFFSLNYFLISPNFWVYCQKNICRYSSKRKITRLNSDFTFFTCCPKSPPHFWSPRENAGRYFRFCLSSRQIPVSDVESWPSHDVTISTRKIQLPGHRFSYQRRSWKASWLQFHSSPRWNANRAGRRWLYL